MGARAEILFRVAGTEDVKRAIEGIAVTAQRGAARSAREHATEVRERVQSEKQAAREVVAVVRQANREKAQEEKAAQKAAAQAAKERVKVEAAAAKERVQAEKIAAREAIAVVRQANREKAAEEKLAAKTASAERVLAARERAARASNRRQAAGEIGSGAASGFKAGVAVIGGAASIQAMQAVRDQMSLEERAALLRNASGKSKADFDSVGRAKAISNLTGVSAGDVMTGFEKLSGKAGGGGLTEYASQYEELAKVARGAGVSMADLGDTLGTLYNRGVKADGVVKVIEALVQQGKDGAVEFNQLATLLDASSGALGKFKMDDATRVMTAGGLSQFARTFGKKSAEESTNAVEDLARDLGGKADVIQRLTGGSLTRVTTKGKKTVKMVNGKMVTTEEGGGSIDRYAGGVEVGTDTNRAQLRDINTLLPDIIEGVVKTGNAGKLTGEGGIFTGNATAIAAPLLQAFTQGISKNSEGRYVLTQDGQRADMSGRAAVEALLKQFQASDVAPGTSAKAFNDVMSQTNAQLNQKIEKLRNDLGDKLTPYAAKAIENPKTTAAAIVAGSTAIGAGNVLAGKAGSALLDKIFPKSVGTMTVTAANVVVGGPGGAGGAAASAAAAGGGSTAITKAGVAAAATTAGAIGAIGANLYGYYKAGEMVVGDVGRLSSGAPASDLAKKIAAGPASEEDKSRADVMLRQSEMMQGNFVSRMAGSALAAGDQMRQDGFSMASLGRILTMPFTMAGGAAASGSPEAMAANKTAGEDLKAALSAQPLKLDPSSQVQIGNTDAIAAAVGSAVGTAVAGAGLQSAKAQIE